MSVFRRPTSYLAIAVLAALWMTAPAVADEDEPREDVSSSTLYPIAPAPGPGPVPAGGPAPGPAAEVADVQVEVGRNQPLPPVVAPAAIEAPAEAAKGALAFTGISLLPLAALAFGLTVLALALIRAGRRRQAGS
jgi:hypothetical protein